MTSSYKSYGLLLYFITNQTHAHTHTSTLKTQSSAGGASPRSNSRLSHEMAVTFDNVSIQCPADQWEIVVTLYDK